MSFVSLNEFKRISGVSDGALVRLLCENALPCSIDPERGILVDIDSDALQHMMQRLLEHVDKELDEQRAVLTERFARIIKTELGQMLEQALSRVAAGSRSAPSA